MSASSASHYAENQDRRGPLCWSRHKDNVGKPRPVAVWTVTYECANRHEVTANCCDPCAASLVDGKQRCARCIKPMQVLRLYGVTASGDEQVQR